MAKFKTIYLHGKGWSLIEDGLIIVNDLKSADEVREYAGELAADELVKIEYEITELADRRDSAEAMMRFANGEEG